MCPFEPEPALLMALYSIGTIAEGLVNTMAIPAINTCLSGRRELSLMIVLVAVVAIVGGNWL